MTAPPNRSSSLRPLPHRWSAPCCDCVGVGPSGWCRSPSLPLWCPTRSWRPGRNCSNQQRQSRCSGCRRRPTNARRCPGGSSCPLARLGRIGHRRSGGTAPGAASPRPDGPAPAPWPQPGHARKAPSSARPPRSPRRRRRRLPADQVLVRSLLRRSCPPPQPTPRLIEPFLSVSSATAGGPWVAEPPPHRRRSPPCRLLLSRLPASSHSSALYRSSWRRSSWRRPSRAATWPWRPPFRRSPWTPSWSASEKEQVCPSPSLSPFPSPQSRFLAHAPPASPCRSGT